MVTIIKKLTSIKGGVAILEEMLVKALFECNDAEVARLADLLNTSSTKLKINLVATKDGESS